jgi:hypothetical protein
VCTYAYINNKFVQDPDPESDPDPDPDTDPESDPKLFEKSDPDPDTDPKKIIPDPQHCLLCRRALTSGSQSGTATPSSCTRTGQGRTRKVASLFTP